MTRALALIPGDVTSKESLQACVDIVKSHTSHADVVTANSGIGGPDISFTEPQTQKPLPIDQLCANLWSPETEQINETYAVNLTGVHFTVAAFLLLHAANQSTDSGRNSTVRPQIITLGSAGAWNRDPTQQSLLQSQKSGSRAYDEDPRLRTRAV
ncbi:hypothetical protein VTN00DRAFT_8653 [Thermoascus crustaceus]|uniref:uncharacterized protein n=1 Tax=Thermoascus crustaceus TaxID=5088 RepID=UPI003743A45C